MTDQSYIILCDIKDKVEEKTLTLKLQGFQSLGQQIPLPHDNTIHMNAMVRPEKIASKTDTSNHCERGNKLIFKHFDPTP